MSGRRYPCPCCGSKRTFRAGQVWTSRAHDDVSIRIVAVDPDGALLEQVGREHLESRWRASFYGLLEGYTLMSAQSPDSGERA